MNILKASECHLFYPTALQFLAHPKRENSHMNSNTCHMQLSIYQILSNTRVDLPFPGKDTTPIFFLCPVPAIGKVLSSTISTPFLQHSTAFSNLIQNVLRIKFETPFSRTLLPGMDDCISVFTFQLLASIIHSACSLLFDENPLGFPVVHNNF